MTVTPPEPARPAKRPRPAAPERPVRRARAAVFAYFGLCGYVMGMWAAGLPALAERLDLGPARLGNALLLISVGALVSMLISGRLADRFTSRVLCRWSGPLWALTLLGPALAPGYLSLAVLCVVFGLGLGVLEVAMNMSSVEVEKRYGRPIVSAFHGVWSLGGAAGGILTAGGLSIGLDSQWMLAAAAVAVAIAYVPAGRPLLGPVEDTPRAAPDAEAAPVRRTGLLLVLVLGFVAFAGHVSEGAAIDWAAFHARRILGADLALAPIAYTAFSVAMTSVRLIGDPIRARLGAVRTIRYAGLFAGAGYGLVLLSPVAGGMAMAYVGWILAGIGLATVVPVIFSAVGAAGGAVGRSLALVSAFGYTGLLAGPAVIGHLAEATSLPIALFVPAGLAVVIMLAGPAAVRGMTGAEKPAAERVGAGA